MKLFHNLLIFRFSSLQSKVYYPALLSPNYDNIEYAPYYVILLYITNNIYIVSTCIKNVNKINK